MQSFVPFELSWAFPAYFCARVKYTPKCAFVIHQIVMSCQGSLQWCFATQATYLLSFWWQVNHVSSFNSEGRELLTAVSGQDSDTVSCNWYPWPRVVCGQCKTGGCYSPRGQWRIVNALVQKPKHFHAFLFSLTPLLNLGNVAMSHYALNYSRKAHIWQENTAKSCKMRRTPTSY